MIEEALSFYYVIIPLALLGGLAGGSTGFGIYLVFGPALWYLLTPTAALATGLAAGLPSLLLLFRLKEYLAPGAVRSIALWALPGVAVGFALHQILATSTLQLAASFIIISFIVFQKYGKSKIPFPLAGWSAGALGSSVGFNGPPVSFAFAGRDERVQRANTILSLFLVSLATALVFALSEILFLKEVFADEFFSGYLLGLMLLPVVALGVFLGDRLARYIGQKIEYIATLLAFAGALVLLLKALSLA